MPQRGACEVGSKTRSCRGFAYSLDRETRMEGLAINKRDHRWRLDFRGPHDAPGSKGQYAGVEVHAGLICLNGPEGMDLDLQLEMFEQALDELEGNDDLVNQVLEISLSDS